ncbi:DEAD/DEAH box helicase family protein [Polaribacter pectinis]|uniref:DEAD/DEAH box helicase family protein n=2 Tax=Polaribacter pectinis TaxID=2738844 RepID=A0A7G9LER5_9FLAO|nr:DEAD/DEAH box helicase family protein [Polaribacter pectinis]
MKLKFEGNLEYQQEAIKSITDIFEGQEICTTNFTVAPIQDHTGQSAMFTTELGVGNKLSLLDEELLENVQKIQLRNGLKQTKELNSRDFSVEMETGTGKTYVYLRSIFEMHKKYGFTKFIIVVPSIAIKEGTNKSLDITKDHFKGIYDNVNYDFFTYDSSKLEQVRSFATNDYIQIMVINIDAFRKSFTNISKETSANIIHRTNDKLSGYKPIDYISSTNPIVIIDEPQSVDTTAKAKEAISSLNPLCTLRYSATHKEKHNLMYKLDSVDAYEQKLVKQIEVASLEVENVHNQAYIKLLKVDNKSGLRAYVEVDSFKNGKLTREKKWVKQGVDLYEDVTRREVYEGYIIKDISAERGNEYIDFTSKPDYLSLGQVIGSVDDDLIKRKQISKTIEEHLNKELLLNPKDIKVLSLFFLDKVSNYRIYDEDGVANNGKYAQMFEEEYIKHIKHPKYKTLFEGIKDLDAEVKDIHNGYFSIDKKSKKSNKKDKFEFFKDSSGTTNADNDAYNLIMKDKERLLSFDSKLRFIFSHSALKEGWDNPNVFQICTLNETSSDMKKRQEIGRGLRLAVNQQGERIRGFEVNTLTVMANQSYEDFVTELQNEIEKDTGIRFGILETHTFANLATGIEGEDNKYFGEQNSEKLYDYMLEKGYIDLKGKVQDTLKTDLKNNEVEIPEAYEYLKTPILKTLKKIAGNLNVKNAEERKHIKLNKHVFLSDDFKSLWDKVKYKTTYSVKFDTEKLVKKCAESIRDNLIAGRGKFIFKKAKAEITKGGVEATETSQSTSLVESKFIYLPDVVSYLQNETNLTRRTVVDILVMSGRLDAFKNNPQRFIDEAIRLIKTEMRHFIVDGISYQKIGVGEYYKQELFEGDELVGYIKENLAQSTKSPFDHVIYDSAIEKDITKDFELSEEVKVYAKLPSWFKIDTPLGTYNPDWAVLWDDGTSSKLYFVVETKGTLSWEFLRPTEKGKIECGKKHFEALGDDIKLEVANSYESFVDVVTGK